MKTGNKPEEEPTTGDVTNESQQPGKENTQDTHEPPAKKPKRKGQNKGRPHTVPKIAMELRICPTIHRGDVCRFGDKCRFKHDLREYMESKAADIGEECVNFKLFGKCKFGVECRFGKHHISPDTFENLVNEDLYKETVKNFSEKDRNVLSKNLMNNLRRKKYKYAKTEKYLKSVSLNDTRPSKVGEENQNPGGNIKDSVNGNENVRIPTETPTPTPLVAVAGDRVASDGCDSSVTTDTTQTKTAIGVVTDEDLIRLRPCEKKKVAIDFVVFVLFAFSNFAASLVCLLISFARVSLF